MQYIANLSAIKDDIITFLSAEPSKNIIEEEDTIKAFKREPRKREEEDLTRYSKREIDIINVIRTNKIDEKTMNEIRKILNSKAMSNNEMHPRKEDFPDYFSWDHFTRDFVHDEKIVHSVSIPLSKLKGLSVLEIPFTEIMKNNPDVFMDLKRTSVDSLQIKVKRFVSTIATSNLLWMSGSMTKPKPEVTVSLFSNGLYNFGRNDETIFSPIEKAGFQPDMLWLQYAPYIVEDFKKYACQVSIGNITKVRIEKNLLTMTVIAHLCLCDGKLGKFETHVKGDLFYFLLPIALYDTLMENLVKALKTVDLNSESLFIRPYLHDNWTNVITDDIGYKISHSNTKNKNLVEVPLSSNPDDVVKIDMSSDEESVKFAISMKVTFRYIPEIQPY
jgi:hypothetical protein